MSDWLELELAQELRPVRAPSALWDRVQAAPRVARVREPWRPGRLWMLAAATLMVASGVVWSGRTPTGLEDLAAQELRGSRELAMQSGNGVEIADWLRREAGLQVSIPKTSRVSLQGARVIRRHGVPIGEIAYRVGGHSAVMLVAHSSEMFHPPAKHGGLSWRSEQQVYAVACSDLDQPQAACLLCHTSL